MRRTVTILAPAFNEAPNIEGAVLDAVEAASDLDDYEIIVANDASTDNSAIILEELSARYSRLRVVHHTTNHGYGGNLRSMFALATKDLIFYTDGDAQYDPAELSKLYARLGPNVDVVQGWKIERHDPLHRKLSGRLYHHFVKWWFGLHLRDVDCDFRLFRRHVLESFPLESSSGCITVEMMTRVPLGSNMVGGSPLAPSYREHYAMASQFQGAEMIAK